MGDCTAARKATIEQQQNCVRSAVRAEARASKKVYCTELEGITAQKEPAGNKGVSTSSSKYTTPTPPFAAAPIRSIGSNHHNKNRHTFRKKIPRQLTNQI
jgi:hypothetical protein